MQMSFIELMDISLAVKRLLYEVNYGYISDVYNLPGIKILSILLKQNMQIVQAVPDKVWLLYSLK